MIVITCQCDQRMKAPDELLGNSCKCVRCGTKISVSAENSRPFQEPAAAAGATPEENAPSLPKDEALPEACKLIGELLVGDGLITQEQLAQALAAQSKRAGKVCEVLLSLGFLDTDKLHTFLSRQSGVPGIDIKNYNIPRDLVELVPAEFAREHLVLPIDKLGKLLTVGMMCPLDTASILEVEQITGLKVKPMLCRLDDLNTVIQRLYPPEETLPEKQEAQAPPEPTAAEKPAATVSPEEVTKRLSSLDSLPSFADTVQRVRETVEDPKSSIRDLNDIIRFDPPVVAKLLSVANATAYGMPGQVKDVALASALLGTEGVCDILMSSKITGAIVELTSFDYNSFADVSLFTATAGQAMADKCEPELRSVVYTAGLLHDIGRLALAESFTEIYADITDSLPHADLLQAEKAVFGLTHSNAGYLLAQEWALPAEIAESIRLHPTPEADSEATRIVKIVALAAAMAEDHRLNSALSDAFFDSWRTTLEALALPDTEVQAAFVRASKALAKSKKKR